MKRAPRLDQDGIDLLSKFLLYEAKRRVSARMAMRHPYFNSLGQGVQSLSDGKGINHSLPVVAINNNHSYLFTPVQSIFSAPGVHLSKNPGYRSSAFSHGSGAGGGKTRRQSMLL